MQSSRGDRRRQTPDRHERRRDLIYDDRTELLRHKRVSDTRFEKVKARFGSQGVVDTTGIVGCYSLLAMQLNVAQYKNPAGPGKRPRLPE